MRVYTRIVINSETGALISREGYDYDGPVELCKASSQEQALSAEQTQFYQTLQSNYSTQFANQSNILSSLNSAFAPILAAGLGQFGFTPAEEAAMRTGAMEQISGAYKNAATATSEAMAARGGGNVSLPSGASAQVIGQIATQAAQAESTAQNQITREGYQIGRQNFTQAANMLGGVGKMYDPSEFGSLSTSAGSTAFEEANKINQENNAWKGELGGALGGIAGDFLGGFGTGLGEKIGQGGGGGGGGDV